MDKAIFAAAGLTIILLAAALITVWSRKNIHAIRAAAIPFALVAAMAAASVLAITMGYGVPLVAGVTAPSGDAMLLSAKMAPGKGIYITLDLPEQPRLFWLPWSREMADKIQEMLDNPENGGVKVTVPPFEWSWDTNPPQFLPLPMPKFLPDKPPEAPAAPHFSA